jgi:uncharacterized protein
MSAPFRVLVSDLVHHPGARRHERVAAPIDDLAVGGSSVPPGGEVDLDLELEAIREGLLAVGTARAPWSGECRRCLQPVSGEVAAAFRELFEENPTEGDSYPLRDDQVDLEPLAREVILLELPQAPLCREDCRGLCARCGADLNEGPCSCDPTERDPRWAALDVLRTDEQE